MEGATRMDKIRSALQLCLSNRTVVGAAKVLFVLFLAGMLYRELTSRDNIYEICREFGKNMRGGQVFWLVATILLMPLNWMAETQKWFQFIERFEPFSFKKAFMAVLAGVSFSLFTPNRVGEYGGRILFVAAQNQWKAIIANLVGNFSQIVVLVSFGLVGTFFFIHEFLPIDIYLQNAFYFGSALAIGLLFTLYFNVDIIASFARRLPLVNQIKRFVKDLKLLRSFTRRELSEILFWSTIRYLIYTTQYYFLIRFLGIEIGFFPAFTAISTIFLLQTSIPLPPITGLLVRGNLAIHIWNFYGANELAVLASTFGLWIINLILPALFGAIFIVNVNTSKFFGNENL